VRVIRFSTFSTNLIDLLTDRSSAIRIDSDIEHHQIARNQAFLHSRQILSKCFTLNLFYVYSKLHKKASAIKAKTVFLNTCSRLRQMTYVQTFSMPADRSLSSCLQSHRLFSQSILQSHLQKNLFDDRDRTSSKDLILRLENSESHAIRRLRQLQRSN